MKVYILGFSLLVEFFLHNSLPSLVGLSEDMEVTLSNTVGAGFLGCVAAAMQVLCHQAIPRSQLMDKPLGYTASLSFRPTGTTVIINSIGYFRKLQCVRPSLFHMSVGLQLEGRRSFVSSEIYISTKASIIDRRYPVRFRLVDTVHMGMTIHTVYYYVIENFGNIFALEEVVW